MNNISISFPDSIQAYIEEQVTQGGYGDISGYLLELVRQDQKRKAKKRLEAMLLEGLNSGTTEMTAQDWENIRQEVRKRISKQQNSI